MFTLFISKTRVLDVKRNEDGSLLISNGDGKSIAFAGSLINSQGGIDAFLSKCVQSEKSAQEIAKERNIQAVITKDERLKQKEINDKANEEYERSIINSYNELVKLEVIPSTVENISVMLHYLNTQNWGIWELPKMEIGYSCNQYDCNGKTATAIVLDKPINYDGEMISRFETGAPRGYLNKYTKLR